MATSKKMDENDDLTDSPSDIERLKPEYTTIDLPDVNDIPGQEHVHPPSLGELADVTISSDDEENILNGDSLDSMGDDDPDADDHSTIGLP
jgi:hypothetical protein